MLGATISTLTVWPESMPVTRKLKRPNGNEKPAEASCGALLVVKAVRDDTTPTLDPKPTVPAPVLLATLAVKGKGAP